MCFQDYKRKVYVVGIGRISFLGKFERTRLQSSLFFSCLIFFTLFFGYGSFAKAERDTLQVKGEVRFIENKGQWEPLVLFKAELEQATLFAEKNCFTFVVSRPNDFHHKNTNAYIEKKATQSSRVHAYKLHFSNFNPNVDIQAENPAEDYINYFIGNDPGHWASKVKHYENVYYKNIYQGIDLKLYSQNAFLKYDFILQPFASPQQIELEYEGLDNIRIQNKNIVLYTSVGEIVELKPIAYQLISGKEVSVDVQYVLHGNKVAFKVGNYDTAYPLVIDPMLVFSTYTGSTADNWGYTATYDKKGNVYTGGVVFGTGYPTNVGAYDGTFNGGNCDIAIFKLNPSGTGRLFATYLGGNAGDMPHSMIVNELNELIVYGTTGSSNFPTSANAYCSVFHGGDYLNYVGGIDFYLGSDIFVSRFSEDGTQLPASTYIGGSKNDGLNYKNEYNTGTTRFTGNGFLYCSYGDGARGELIVDDLNNVYVGSCTFSSDFPTTQNAFQSASSGGQEGVTFKLDYNLSNLIWSSYLGGSGDDAIYSIDVDSHYNLIVTGGTTSRDFPTTSNAYTQNYIGGNTDGFVTRIAYAGNVILNSTYFGSGSYDQSYFVRTDRNDNIYIAGLTTALNSSLVYSSSGNPLYNVPNSGQFIAKLNSGLSVLNWSTVFGSGDLTAGPDLSLTAFGIDRCNRIYLAGWGRCYAGDGSPVPWNTYGTTHLYITTNAYQRNTDGQDFYIMTLSPEATGIDYATFLGEIHGGSNPGGNDHVDGGTSRFDKFGTLYQSVCASCGGTQEFPIEPNSGAWSSTNNATSDGKCNNAIFSFSIHDDFPVADFIAPLPVCSPEPTTFQNTGRGDHFHWDFGDGITSIDQNPIHVYTNSGLYTVTLIAYKNSGCSLSDTIQKQIMVLGDTSYYLPDIYTCPSLSVQIGITPVQGMSYQWNTSQELTDSTISNPFATVTKDVLFYMISSNGICTDTIYQWVKIRYLAVDAGDSLITCISPGTLVATPLLPNVSYQWSSNNLFTDTLNTDRGDNAVLIYFSQSRFYYVKIEDVNGCYGIDSIYVEYTPITSTPVLTPVTCFGLCNGEAFVSILGTATPPVNYNWSNGSTASSVQNLCARDYFVTVSDAAGCLQTQLFEILQPEKIVLNQTIVNESCSGSCNGSIRLNITGGTPPYRILWNTGDTTAFIQNLCEGAYSVIITDSNNCEYFDTLNIYSVGDFSVDTEVKNNTCTDYCTGMVIASAKDGVAPYIYSWSNGQVNDTVLNLCEGEYTLITTDARNCEVFDTIHIGNSYTFDSNMYIWADKYTLFENESTVLHATLVNNVNYLWFPPAGLYTPTSPNTTAKPLQTTTYYLQSTDLQGCVFLDSLEINVIIVNCGQPDIFVPNAFTPNGDGKNDLLCVDSKWVTSYYLAIFNRWGEKIFESADPNACWDGTFKGKICEQGVYVYTLEVSCETNKHYKTKGDITLIR